ncbi:MAG: hypothetical protein AAF941_08185 [Pseudomonadota bacterium]
MWLTLAVLALSSCSDDTQPINADGTIGVDPLVARALNDPLMVDPDLAYRNEANAAITIRHDHALPTFAATTEASQRAREVARLELLDGGSISNLPAVTIDEGVLPIGGLSTAGEIVEAVGGPGRCTDRLGEGLAWAARMPEVAQVMPHGMVQQAAGVDAEGCTVRVVRYLTPVAIEDALQYHFNRAVRARLSITRLDDPEAILQASRGDMNFIVHARPAAGGMKAIDLVYWED